MKALGSALITAGEQISRAQIDTHTLLLGAAVVVAFVALGYAVLAVLDPTPVVNVPVDPYTLATPDGAKFDPSILNAPMGGLKVV